jgi:hypothetical protein
MIYIVTLSCHEHLDEFYNHMETETSLDHVPNRACNCVDRMPISRNTAYSLEHHEAVALTNDPRVIAVTMSWQLRGIVPELNGWTSSSSTIGVDFDQTVDQTPWGIYRTRTKDDIPMGSPYNANLSASGTRVVNHELSGKNVDVVIVDGGHFNPQTLEYRSKNENGATRVITFNWYDNDPVVTGGKFKYGPYNFYNLYTTLWNIHQAHTAGTTAGNTKGLARDADIYSIKYGLSYSYGVRNSYVSQLYCFQFIKQWHLNKKINPFTGVKNPSITNNSWGYSYPLNSIFYLTWATKIVHRGEEILPSSGDPLLGTATYSKIDLNRVGFLPKQRIPVRDAAIDADIIDLAAAGVINVVSAGNSAWYCDVPGGPDYNNYFLMYTTVTITLTGPCTFDGSNQVILQSNHPEIFPPAVVIKTSGTTNVIVGTGFINPFFDTVNTLISTSTYPYTDLGPNSVPIKIELGGLTPIYFHRGSSPAAIYQGDLSPICVGAMGATVPGNDSYNATTGTAHYGNYPVNTKLAQGNYKSEFSNYGPRIDVFAPGALTVSVYCRQDNVVPALKPGNPAFYNTSKVLLDSRELTLNPDEEDNGNVYAVNSYLGIDSTNSTAEYSRNVMAAIAGTSMAGPHVTGALACMLERNPGWTQKEARAWIAANSPESMVSTNGGTSDTTDLGLSRNPSSNKKLLYLPSSRFLDDTPNSTPTSGYQTASFPCNITNYRQSQTATIGQTYPRNKIRLAAPKIPANATITLSVNQTRFTESNFTYPAVIFTVRTTNVPNGTQIPYSITPRTYRNKGFQYGTASIWGLYPLFDNPTGEYNNTMLNFYNYVTITNNVGTLTRWIGPLNNLGPTYTELPWTWQFQFRLITPDNPYINITVDTVPFPTTASSSNNLTVINSDSIIGEDPNNPNPVPGPNIIGNVPEGSTIMLRDGRILDLK